ncbi:MAG: hypothetical protein HYX24_06260 [Candidatus Aenigmarchaeota archaeon]|nr:hypothetical protein [Candidatus Aenigmarchaeota archaeon]
MLSNYATASKARVESEKSAAKESVKESVLMAEEQLRKSKSFASDADINGICVRLITNSLHQHDFWTENWNKSSKARPDAVIYSVNGIGGQKPSAKYCGELDTAVFVNTEYYGQCKSWALGMASKIMEADGIHSIHAASAVYNGKGVIIVAPTGTGKTTQTSVIFMSEKGRLIGDDWVHIDQRRKDLSAVQPERKLYIRTENAREQKWLIPILQKSKCENVIEKRGECSHEKGDICGIEMGHGCCFWGFANARAIADRHVLSSGRVAEQAPLDLIVLLRRDNKSPAYEELDPDKAIEILRSGEYMIRPGAGPREMWGKMGKEPWYNPYLLVRDDRRQERFFRKEMERARCIIINTGAEGEIIERTHQRIVKALEGE